MRKEIIGSCELYCGDCMELMARYPDKHFDLAIVDPPYGIKAENGTGKYSRKYILSNKKWDVVSSQEYFQELFRVSKNQIVWGANYFTAHLPVSQGWICWYKTDEVKGRSFSEFELAFTNFNRAARFFSCKPFLRNGERIHPTQKPVSLYKWILSKYANAGDLILDTHLGSGSIAVACNELGFSLVGAELDADYFSTACKRIEEANAQGQLFSRNEARL